MFKVSGANGVNIISDKGVSEYLRNQFKLASYIQCIQRRKRKVMLEDMTHSKKEYLLTIIRNEFAPSYGSFEEDELIGNWSAGNSCRAMTGRFT